jgi:Flavin containing amine oxidoreductase
VDAAAMKREDARKTTPRSRGYEASEKVKSSELCPRASEAEQLTITAGINLDLEGDAELCKAGYDCVVLEARDRAGGRNWTVRPGTRLDMTDGSRQICDFDEGLYWNAGAARLPSHHQAILGYCRESHSS